MKYDPNKHHRRSIRLQGYDYSSAGAYFITICTENRKCLFGNIINEKMILNNIGYIVVDSLLWLEKQYKYVKLDEMVVMPNHIHAILFMVDCRGGSQTAPTEKRKPLGRLIGAFKTVSTKRINEINKTSGIKLWQRNYYEHIIRNEIELKRIREYITNNPLKWEFDKENPVRITSDLP